MRETAFWKADWFPGLVVSGALFAVAGFGATNGAATWAVTVLIAVYLVALLPRLPTAVAISATTSLVLVIAAAHFVFKSGWPLLTPVAFLLLGHLLLGSLRLFSSPRRKSGSTLTSMDSGVRRNDEPGTEQQLPGRDADDLPARIGRYRIEKKLGKGAMGEVFLGRDPETGTLAAIKTLALAQEFSPDELADVRARFFREAETAARLRHPNIVAVLDTGEDGGLAYIAMEFLAGTDLRRFARPERLLPLPCVVSVVARIADALAYAHANHVVHRDVKPANAMYDPATDEVRIMDFGIARITDASRTKTGMVLGTPSYMSPEQLLGKKVDGRTDLYALGVMLYQMSCGQPPFVGQSMGQLMLRIANEPCPDVRALNPLVPEALAAVIERAMRKDAAQRFQTGDEMARALRACFGDGLAASDREK